MKLRRCRIPTAQKESSLFRVIGPKVSWSASLSTRGAGNQIGRRNEALRCRFVEHLRLKKMNSDMSYFDAACEWLHANNEIWQAWLPDKTKCFERFGLYNEKEDARPAFRAPRHVGAPRCGRGCGSGEVRVIERRLHGTADLMEPPAVCISFFSGSHCASSTNGAAVFR